jgi:two-component system, chemotaxis family, protein-glutamate methylesterase/glutaminase
MYNFHVVAIGSSAGGLEPLRKLVSLIPPDINAAFVTVQHLHPSFRSRLDSILGRSSNLPVVRLEHNQAIKSGRVYVLAENKMVELSAGQFIVRNRRADEKINHAVDIFFHSLAEEAKEKAVGIILSGSNNDGSSGARHIHERGGLVIVQDPKTAAFPEMPLGAIKSDHPEIGNPDELMSALIMKISGQKMTG